MPFVSRTVTRTSLCLALSAVAVALGSVPSARADSPSPAAATASTAATRTAWPTLRPGSSGVHVKTAQHLLREMSTLASPVGDSGVLVVDGRFGPDTTRAVEEFQTRYELPADGVIGTRTWEALVVTVGRGSRGSAVMGLQLQLRALQYDVAVDGRYGPRTASAVATFQRSAGTRADGVTGRATWRGLLTGVVAPPASAGRPSCGQVWGSHATSAGASRDTGPSYPITDVRAGRHACFDRLVLDVADRATAVSVRYVDRVTAPGPVPVSLAGQARLLVEVDDGIDPAARFYSRRIRAAGDDTTYRVGDVVGFRTLREVRWLGTMHPTQFAVGVRARLPFRVFVVDGPGGGSRLVLDVGHQSCSPAARSC